MKRLLLEFGGVVMVAMYERHARSEQAQCWAGKR
jgi:hypothetical protein